MKKQFFLVLILFFLIPVAMARLASAAGPAALLNTPASLNTPSAVLNAPAIISIKKLKKPLDTGNQAGEEKNKNTPDVTAALHFQNAVNLMKSGDYKQALSEFRASRAGLPFLDDYVCFYEARMCWDMKDPGRAAGYLNELLKNHPRTPLAAKAKLMAISMATDKDTLIPMLEDFTRRYPGHDGMELRLAQLLMEKGKTGPSDKMPADIIQANKIEAGKILENIYVRAGNLSAEALAELGRQPTLEETLMRAENLLRSAHPREAEHELLSMPDDPGYLKDKMDLLGGALFMQKRYNEAADVYSSVADTYKAARAYYRAGNEDNLKKAIDELSSANDRKASYLLLDLASIERRKDNNFAGAILELKEASEKYPWIAEDAMWETAWLYYVQKDYKDAARIFSKLSNLYDEPEYLYWQAKSLEGLGGTANAGHAQDIYRKLVSEDEGYYSVLASLKTGIPIKEEVLPEQAVRQLKNSAALMRFKVLMTAGLRNEALSDLAYDSRNCMNRNTLIWIANQLKKMGAFRNAIAVAMRLPEDMQPRNVLYPHAFWGRIEKDCSTTGLDPYLVLSVMREESRFDPQVCSRAGAIGLMQLMPQTAKKYSAPLRLVIKDKKSIYSINANVALGTFYLNKLYNDFRAIPPTLAAYNAGEAVVRKWLAEGNYASFDEFVEDIPYGETKNYIKRIITTYYRYGGEEATKDFFLADKTGNP